MCKILDCGILGFRTYFLPRNQNLRSLNPNSWPNIFWENLQSSIKLHKGLYRAMWKTTLLNLRSTALSIITSESTHIKSKYDQCLLLLTNFRNLSLYLMPINLHSLYMSELKKYGNFFSLKGIKCQ